MLNLAKKFVTEMEKTPKFNLSIEYEEKIYLISPNLLLLLMKHVRV